MWRPLMTILFSSSTAVLEERPAKSGFKFGVSSRINACQALRSPGHMPAPTNTSLTQG